MGWARGGKRKTNTFYSAKGVEKKGTNSYKVGAVTLVVAAAGGVALSSVALWGVKLVDAPALSAWV